MDCIRERLKDFDAEECASLAISWAAQSPGWDDDADITVAEDSETRDHIARTMAARLLIGKCACGCGDDAEAVYVGPQVKPTAGIEVIGEAAERLGALLGVSGVKSFKVMEVPAAMVDPEARLTAAQRAESAAWRALAAIVAEKDPEAGGHPSGCPCPAWGCRYFNAARGLMRLARQARATRRPPDFVTPEMHGLACILSVEDDEYSDRLLKATLRWSDTRVLLEEASGS